MHQWDPEQFYYATITGQTFRTLRVMEDDMELTTFTGLIPKWFEPSREDWGQLFDGSETFSTLAARVQVTILITYFHRQFQVRTRTTPFGSHVDEPIEEWVKRIDRMV